MSSVRPYLMVAVSIIGLVFFTSCTWSDPVKVEDDFGNSVRHMIEQQTQTSPQVPKTMESNPPGLDGNSAINSLNQYRSAQVKKTQKKSLDSLDLSQ